MQGSPSAALPVPLHFSHITSLVIELLPLPLQTIQGTFAPSGFFPVPEQKTHSLNGSSISTTPNPLHTWHCENFESKLNGSFPVPRQKGQLISVLIAAIF